MACVESSPACGAGSAPRLLEGRPIGGLQASTRQATKEALHRGQTIEQRSRETPFDVSSWGCGCSSMGAAGPAVWPPHPFHKLRAHPFDMLPPCLIFLDREGTADPFIACERRYVFPFRPCLRVGCERRPKTSRKIMNHSSRDSNACHRFTSLDIRPRARPAKDQASDARVQLGFRDYRQQPGSNPFVTAAP